MAVDSHAHLDAEEFDADREEVIKRCAANGLTAVISCGTTLSGSQKNAALACEHEIVFSAVGIHPHESYQMEADTVKKLKKLAENEKVVAIGETGLDYHYNFSLPEIQRKAFQIHIRLARELGLPLVIHCRNAEEDLIRIMKEENAAEAGGNIHCFTGTLETAKICLDLGFYIGASGILTFKTARELAETFSKLPIEKLLIETDSPYLAPVPHRGRRNEPSYVMNTALMLAQLKGLPVGEVEKITAENASRLFKIAAK